MNLYVDMELHFQIHSDQGRSFEAKLFIHLLATLRIEKTRTTSQRPEANGTVERFNRTLVNMITIYSQKDQRKWNEVLPQVIQGC